MVIGLRTSVGDTNTYRTTRVIGANLVFTSRIDVIGKFCLYSEQVD